MQRRQAILAATGAATVALLNAPRAFAQTPAPQMIGTGRYRMQTLQLGSFSKQSAQLAQQRASFWQIRQFGAFEADEQTALAQVLTDKPTPPLAPIDPTQTQALEALSTLNGKDFDAAFLRGQLQTHQQLLEVQQAFLNGAENGSDLQHIANLARMVIMQHMTMLHDMQNWIPGMVAVAR